MLSVRPGDVLAGKYRVERVLGSGGMGYVVAARHLQLDQLVAMKFLRKGACPGDEASTRFLREAKAVVKLRNEHIAKVYDVGTLESGEPYIVMEHLDGCDLSALAKERGALSVPEACEYLLQACEALAEAHSIGIVHRDIKLANIFVTRGPAGGPLVKVLDFGISKTNPFGESEHEMTRTTSMLGSPRFMSPEQMRDPRAVDGRSDIWSLGVVLYRLVAGRPPFEAETLGRLLTMVMHEYAPPISSLRSDLPPGFEYIVGRCLEKDPNARFANVAELAYALALYCVQPQRARSIADRVAAILNLPQLPQAVDLATTVSPSNRVSTPPGASDTGTAAPWAGTHGGGATARTPARGGTAWVGVALTAVLIGSGLFVKIRHDREQAAAVAAATAEASEPTAQAATVFAESAPPPTMAPAIPTVIGASTQPGPYIPYASGPSAQTERKDERPVAPSSAAAPRRPAVAPPRRPPPPPRTAQPAKNEDGIPTTRD